MVTRRVAQHIPEGLRPFVALGCCPTETAQGSSLLALPASLLPPPSPCHVLAARAGGGTKGRAPRSGLAEPDDSDLDKPLSLC